MSYKPVDLHKKKSEVLVIHCSDPRFQAAYRSEMDNLGKYYDLVVAPGASKAVTNDPSVLNHVKLLHELHHFSEIHIFNHIDCGAFGKVKNEIEERASAMKAAKEKLEKAIPDMIVKAYLLGQHDKLLAIG